ncbi:protein lethal(2)essential for life-like isoform X2 [Diabrotica virgifera virgifera]|uniref:Protein lethal(2)essential for life-like isoform X2 n=1 Tax=Diabrotica virgifera virgifera TaxID=50390 RepID=A0A6P7FGE2_DIAVI|nr:protein lethal(2)essential for life-like isoform X2 [Diabrotica virgifera virgifera]
MSMVPLLFRDWWDEEDLMRPSRLLDQQFGLGLRRDDLLNSIRDIPRRSALSSRYIRPWATSTALQRQDSGSTITQDQNKFQVILDVQQFAPNEITVKTNGNSILVEGKHEEKQDEHGYIMRHFVRRYVLPQTHDAENVVSSLSSDGVLTVSAPKKSEKPVASERVVPITQTGPAKSTVTPVVESPQPQPQVN